MLEMYELFELYEESNELQMDVMFGESDFLQMEVGGGSWEFFLNFFCGGVVFQLEEEGFMEEEVVYLMVEFVVECVFVCWFSFGELLGQIVGFDFESEDEGEEFDDWEDDYDYLEEEQLSGVGYRVLVVFEEVNKMFLRIF